ncbi:conserved hypothetical protein [Ricinus communis]|uniref:Uncharacterized protein n=1 Tax=Ricinus communis TaxID=3988 RepID=B9TLZ4_RICCO|nr:conserved hypothetical protein [Ricinus communis]
MVPQQLFAIRLRKRRVHCPAALDPAPDIPAAGFQFGKLGWGLVRAFIGERGQVGRPDGRLAFIDDFESEHRRQSDPADLIDILGLVEDAANAEQPDGQECQQRYADQDRHFCLEFHDMPRDQRLAGSECERSRDTGLWLDKVVVFVRIASGTVDTEPAVHLPPRYEFRARRKRRRRVVSAQTTNNRC